MWYYRFILLYLLQIIFYTSLWLGFPLLNLKVFLLWALERWSRDLLCSRIPESSTGLDG